MAKRLYEVFTISVVVLTFIGARHLSAKEASYRNPVIDRDLADPVVILHEGLYHLYATNDVDGDNGYEAYRQFKPDLVFTDVVMPKMSGLELVRKIREADPDIKVIYISGFFGIKRLKQELDEDISTYGYPTLAKPFRTSDMLDLVKNYITH